MVSITKSVRLRRRTTSRDAVEKLLDDLAALGPVSDCPAARIGALAAINDSQHHDLIRKGAEAAGRLPQPKLKAVLMRCLQE